MRKFHRKHLCWNLLLLKLQALQATPTQVFSCETCETFKNTYFVEHLQTAASGSCKHSIWACYKVKNVDSTEFFRKMKLATLPPTPQKKSCWKYSLRIVLEFFKNCQEYINIETKSLKMLWEGVQFNSLKSSARKFITSLKLY